MATVNRLLELERSFSLLLNAEDTSAPEVKIRYVTLDAEGFAEFQVRKDGKGRYAFFGHDPRAGQPVPFHTVVAEERFLNNEWVRI